VWVSKLERNDDLEIATFVLCASANEKKRVKLNLRIIHKNTHLCSFYAVFLQCNVIQSVGKRFLQIFEVEGGNSSHLENRNETAFCKEGLEFWVMCVCVCVRDKPCVLLSDRRARADSQKSQREASEEAVSE
jgi:hypothetical protein